MVKNLTLITIEVETQSICSSCRFWQAMVLFQLFQYVSLVNPRTSLWPLRIIAVTLDIKKIYTENDAEHIRQFAGARARL